MAEAYFVIVPSCIEVDIAIHTTLDDSVAGIKAVFTVHLEPRQEYLKVIYWDVGFRSDWPFSCLVVF